MRSLYKLSKWGIPVLVLLAAGCGSELIAGTRTPTIVLTSVPPRGSFANLEGEVQGVVPAEHGVAVFILVGNGWWTKPWFSQPLTTIRDHGGWVTDITTGGIDETASAIAVFLVPNTYDPPLARGSRSLPTELAQNALSSIQVRR